MSKFKTFLKKIASKFSTIDAIRTTPDHGVAMTSGSSNSAIAAETINFPLNSIGIDINDEQLNRLEILKRKTKNKRIKMKLQKRMDKYRN